MLQLDFHFALWKLFCCLRNCQTGCCWCQLNYFLLWGNMRAEGTDLMRYRRGTSVGLTNIFWACACMWETEIQESYIVSISSPSQRQDYMALFCLRACHRPFNGFQFQPPQHISNAIASYCNLLQANWKIPRCESVCVGSECTGWLLTLFFFLYMARSPACPPIWVCECWSSCNQVLRKGKEKKESLLSQSKEGGWQWSH